MRLKGRSLNYGGITFVVLPAHLFRSDRKQQIRHRIKTPSDDKNRRVLVTENIKLL